MRLRRGSIDDGARPEGGGLFQGSPGVARTPRQLMEERRRAQVLHASLDVFGEKGFARATVQDLIEAAGISRATLYKYFGDREDCLAALNDALLAWLEREAREAIASADDWPSRVRAVTERLVGLVSGDVRVARVCGFEATLVSDDIRARRQASIDAIAAALRRGREHSRWGDQLPPALEEFLVAGAISLATRTGIRDGYRPPADLGSQAAEFVLLPYVGAARARKLVRGG